MKYCVLVKISKHQLSFWYQLENGVPTPLSITGPNTIPLCFYVNGNDFKIGIFAKERFLQNDRSAYDDYFELIKDPVEYFTLHGDSKPVKQLLYYGVENYLSHFIKTILYKNESIEGFRTTFCLRLWFDDDIENQEKVLVENLFKEAGYENISEINPNLFLNQEISQETKSSRTKVCLSAISNDLYLRLYKSPDFNLAGHIKLSQLGSDPRAKILAKLILEDIKEASPHIYIDEEKEIAHIINHCAKLLSALSPLMRNEIELSTGVKADYKIRLAHLEERLMYNRGIEDKVIPELEGIISANSLSNSIIDIILHGDELNTNYFKDKLTKKFPNVYGVGSAIENKLLKSIFAEIALNDYQLISKNFTSPNSTTTHTQTGPTKTTAPPLLPNGSRPISAPPLPVPGRPVAPPPIPGASRPPLPIQTSGNSRPVAQPPIPGLSRSATLPPPPSGARTPVPPIVPLNNSNKKTTKSNDSSNSKKGAIPPPPPPPPTKRK